MGEIAEMMLDGTMCACCGELLIDPSDEGEPAGYPIYCASCSDAIVVYEKERIPEPRFACPKCDRKFGTIHGYEEHYTVKHIEAGK